MSHWAANLVNSINNIQLLRYLELGVSEGLTFNAVKAGYKKSVDINGQATYTMTTDDFFKMNAEKFDVVFIDADHQFSSAVKDYNNAIEICDKMLFIHDLYPPNLAYTDRNLCGDSYKLLYCLRSLPGGKFYTLSEDYGLTLVVPPFTKMEQIDHAKDLTYEVFVKDVSEMPRYSPDQMKSIIASLI